MCSELLLAEKANAIHIPLMRLVLILMNTHTISNHVTLNLCVELKEWPKRPSGIVD